MSIIIGPGVNVSTTVLGAPTIGSVSTATANSMYVSFTQPANDGGVPIQYYVGTASPGGLTGTINQAGSGSVIVGGLTLGQTYTFTVAAYNWFGLGPSSSATNSILVATVPNPPTAVTANFSSLTVVTLTFSAPIFNGGSSITKYVATSSPGNITGTLSQAGSGTITVSGLSVNTLYTFTVTATNSIGTSNVSTASNAVQMSAGSQSYTTPGTYTWVAPVGVTSVSVVAVGGGGTGGGAPQCGGGAGGGGGLGYKNNISVTPGNSYTVVVGCAGFSYNLSTFGAGGSGTRSYFINACTVAGLAGYGGGNGGGGGYVGDGGGNGGKGRGYNATRYEPGGGGAGGYTGPGGWGANSSCIVNGCGGCGGGGGGGSNGQGGGGVGLFGKGASGAGGVAYSTTCAGGGGSGGSMGGVRTGSPLAFNCWHGGNGGLYGGGGGGDCINGGRPGSGAQGAVRIVWPGQFRNFPYSCQVGSP